MSRLEYIKLRYQVYVIGIGYLDEDHFRMLDLIDSAKHQTSRVVLLDILDKLVEVMEDHAVREELLLQRIDYPYYASHLRVHDEIRGKVARVVKSVGESSTDFSDRYNPVNQLGEVFLEHFDSYDRQFATYCASHPEHVGELKCG